MPLKLEKTIGRHFLEVQALRPADLAKVLEESLRASDLGGCTWIPYQAPDGLALHRVVSAADGAITIGSAIDEESAGVLLSRVVGVVVVIVCVVVVVVDVVLGQKARISDQGRIRRHLRRGRLQARAMALETTEVGEVVDGHRC